MAIPLAGRPASRRFDTIDMLRGLSILAVVLLHIAIRFSFLHLSLRPVLSPWLYHLLLSNGGNGVTIFFAISGFLITFTSMQRFGDLGKLHPRIFYQIRFARIGPPLLLLLAVLTVLHLAHVEGYVIKNGTLGGALLSALSFTLNWYEAVHGYLPAVWTVLWSLSIEEMFYLFFPLVCLLLLRRRGGLWMWVLLLLAFVVMDPFAKTVWTSNEIWRENTYLGGMGAIALGCLTAVLTKRLERRPISSRLLLSVQGLGALLMTWILCWPRWHWLRPVMHRLAVSGTDDLILPLGTCLVMLASVIRVADAGRERDSGSKLLAPVRWFGRHSYEVYLTHEFVVIAGVEWYERMSKTHRPGPLWLWFAGILAMTAPLGFAMSRLFSEPLNRRLRRASQNDLQSGFVAGVNPTLHVHNSSLPMGAQSIHSRSSSETG